MPTTKDLKQRIEAVKATHQITQAMKMVSVAKLQQAQKKWEHLIPYVKNYQQLIAQLCPSNQDHPLLKSRSNTNTLLLLIGTNKGLCGSYNRYLYAQMKKHIASFKEKKGRVTLLPIGERSLKFSMKQELPLIVKYLTTPTEYDQVKKTVVQLQKDYLEKKYDNIQILYQPNKRATKENLQIEQFLPIIPPPNLVLKELPDTEPIPRMLFHKILPTYLTLQLYVKHLQAQISEHHTRMVTMHQATENATALIKQLKTTYNQSRQAAITSEITEIVAAINALQ